MSDCAICSTPNAFVEGGWLCLTAYGSGLSPRVCRACTALLVMSWAKEMKRRNDFPGGNSPTPTSPPSGDTQATELSMSALEALAIAMLTPKPRRYADAVEYHV
jgi:hypothetical protein